MTTLRWFIRLTAFPPASLPAQFRRMQRGSKNGVHIRFCVPLEAGRRTGGGWDERAERAPAHQSQAGNGGPAAAARPCPALPPHPSRAIT